MSTRDPPTQDEGIAGHGGITPDTAPKIMNQAGGEDPTKGLAPKLFMAAGNLICGGLETSAARAANHNFS